MYHLLINNRENTNSEHLSDFKVFIEYWNNMNHITENIKTLIVFNDMIADILNNKKLNTITTELFI